MATVKFENIEVGQVYVTRGGTAVSDKSHKTMGWGYDRVRVIKKNDTQMVVQTPWGTECILIKGYPLFETCEVEVRCEFKLVTNFLSKKEIPFDDALQQGICAENIPLESDSFLKELIKYFAKPQLVADAVKKFGEQYQKVRYAIKKVEQSEHYQVIRDIKDGRNVVHIIKVEK